MRRSEIPAVFCKFKDLRQRVLRCLQLNEDDSAVKDEFDQLTLLVTENLELFSEEERDFILLSQAVFTTPRYRIARARSNSRSSLSSHLQDSSSSPESSFASTSTDSAPMTDTTKQVPSGAANASSSRQLKELELRYDMEEEAEALKDQIHDEKRRLEDAQRRVEDERRKVKKQIEAKQRASRRAILQRAKEESLSDDFVADLLKSLEVVTIEDEPEVASSPSNPPSPPSISIPVSSPTDQEDRLLQLLGS